MIGNSAKNIIVSYKPEVTFNLAVSGGGATQFRANPGPGMDLKRARVQSNEFRKDGMKSMFRLGSREVAGGPYETDLVVGAIDALVASIFRNTFTVSLALVAADFTTITTTAHSIVFAANSPITKGIRIGDVLVLSAMPDAANNKNVRVTGLSATTITVAETLIVNAVGSAAPTITRPKKVVNSLGAPFTLSSYTVEEYYEDFDDSKIFSGCRVSMLKFAWGPDAMVKVSVGFVGADMTIPGGASAPTFTSPTYPLGIGLTAQDAVLRFNGADVAVLTSGEITIDLGGKGIPVIGAVVTPDIYLNAFDVKGQFTGVRTSMANEAAFTAETEFDAQMLCVDNVAEPKNFVNLYLPRLKYTGAGAPFGADGPVIETLPWEAAAKEVTSGYDSPNMIVFQTSAP